MFLWGWDAEFARETERDRGFKFLSDHINTRSWQKQTYCAYSLACEWAPCEPAPIALHSEFFCFALAEIFCVVAGSLFTD